MVPSEALEQFVGVETDRLDHALLGMKLLLDLLQTEQKLIVLAS